MFKKFSLKIVTILLIIVIAVGFKSNICYAEVNTLYGNPAGGTSITSIPSSILLEWISSLAYNFGTIIEDLGANVMGWFTGTPAFPYSDKIIFNATPILDPNFINPSRGSLFEDSNGNITMVGTAIRNTYFSVLSIALGFLGLVIAIVAIRLAFSTISSEKAKYKQAIANAIITIILLFGMHYVLSFMLYLNESLVEVASVVLLDIFAGDEAEDVMKAMDESLMKDDKKLIENFFDKMGPNWFSPLTWAREVIHGLANLGQTIINAVADVLGKVIDTVTGWFGGDDSDDDEVTLDPDDEDQLASIEKIYPSRKEFQSDILDDEKATHIAAYLLRSETYRDVYLRWAEGSDMDSLDKNGLSGMAIGIASMINDCLNIVDSGYLGIRSLHASTFYIKNGTYKSLIDGNAVTDSPDELPNKITSTKAYNEYIIECNNNISRLEKERSELNAVTDPIKREQKKQEIKIYKSLKVYAQAYYKFVYEGDDKVQKGAKDMISEMGTYFKQNAKYVDLEAGDWAPTSTSIPFGLLYAIFIVQSLMFFVSYIKRLFYIVILSVFGPIVVVFDYMVKSI